MSLRKIIFCIFPLFLLCTSFVYGVVIPDSIIIYPEDELRMRAKDKIIAKIKSAKISIKMSIYQIKEPDIIEALCAQSTKGVRVDVICEETPYQHAFNKRIQETEGLLTKLLNANVHLHLRPENLKKHFPKGHYHARYIIIDKDRFLLTTGNFDETTFDHARDFCIIFSKEKNETIFNTLLQLFDRDISNQTISDLNESPSLIIGPHGQREKIIGFLSGATKNIKMYQQFFNDPVIQDVIKKLMKEKGITVDVVMMAYPTNYHSDPNEKTQDDLEKSGVDIRLMDHLYAHARAIIIDDKHALIGTTQLSPPSLDENREISIIIEGDVVKKLINQFKYDQVRAQSITIGRARALQKKCDWGKLKLFR